MDIGVLLRYVHEKNDVEDTFPFDEETLVCKVNAKMFMLCSLEKHPLQINLKCDPDLALDLREEYPENILPGYHMHKKHWNTIVLNGKIPSKLVFEMIDNSYNLVVGAQKKK